jgi:flagellar biosynthesis activator protein FlaF
MHYAANAYSKVAQATQSPRELEAAILMKAATRLQSIREDWEARASELNEALTYNRKIWTILVTSVTRQDNPLPGPIKQNIANLGLFIFNHTLSLMGDAKPEKLGILVTINREIAAGLRGLAVPGADVPATGAAA